MKEIFDIFESIKNINGTKNKKEIIKQNSDNAYFIFHLEFLLNPHKVTGINKGKLNKELPLQENEFKSFEEVLCYLMIHNTGTDETISKVKSYLQQFDGELKEFLEELVCKSYRLGVKTKLVNSVIPNLIPEFNVMLAESYDKNIKYVEGKNFILTTKLDGIRCVVIKDNNKIECYTRQGKSIDNLIELEEEFKKLPNGVYDGELLAQGEFTDSKEQFKETMKRVRIKGNKTRILFKCFDYIDDVNEFNSNVSIKKCIDRKQQLKEIINNSNVTLIEYLEPLYIGNDISKIQEYSKIAQDNNEEGLMLNIADAYYQYKRTKDILKVKVMKTCDIRCLDVIEGDGKFKNTLGSILCDYKGFELNVGSGFKDETRHSLWNDKSQIIGKIVEIQYFEELETDGKLSLRFPVFLRIRDDKDEVSYH